MLSNGTAAKAKFSVRMSGWRRCWGTSVPFTKKISSVVAEKPVWMASICNSVNQGVSKLVTGTAAVSRMVGAVHRKLEFARTFFTKMSMPAAGSVAGVVKVSVFAPRVV